MQAQFGAACEGDVTPLKCTCRRYKRPLCSVKPLLRRLKCARMCCYSTAACFDALRNTKTVILRRSRGAFASTPSCKGNGTRGIGSSSIALSRRVLNNTEVLPRLLSAGRV